jgi:hypothetical protein
MASVIAHAEIVHVSKYTAAKKGRWTPHEAKYTGPSKLVHQDAYEMAVHALKSKRLRAKPGDKLTIQVYDPGSESSALWMKVEQTHASGGTSTHFFNALPGPIKWWTGDDMDSSLTVRRIKGQPDLSFTNGAAWKTFDAKLQRSINTKVALTSFPAFVGYTLVGMYSLGALISN